MSVRISLDLPEGIYRSLVHESDRRGKNVRGLLREAADRAAGAMTPFEEWLASLDPAQVRKERPRAVLAQLRDQVYDNETEKLRAYLRAQNTRRTAA